MTVRHILLFEMRSVCYDSYIYFAESLASALRALGHTVEIFSLLEHTVDDLENYCHRSFDAMIDFNSTLPSFMMEDGSYFLDQIDAPFYDILLDHPLYHHNMLRQPLQNFHVLCLDENHVRYVRSCYPHIRSAFFWAVTGEDLCPSDPSYPEKEIPLLFSGTYTSSAEIEDAIEKTPSFLAKLTHTLIDQILADDGLTQEDALMQSLPSLDEAEQSMIRENFPLHMQACFLCDSWIRAYKREQLLSAIIHASLPLTLCGNGWQKFPDASAAHVRIISDMSFADTFSLFRRSQITLNLLPEFKNGTHDRIYSALLNHSLCATDASPLLQTQFTDSRDLLFFDARNPEALTGHLQTLLADPDRLEEISQSGYAAAIRSHTWNSRATALLDCLQ